MGVFQYSFWRWESGPWQGKNLNRHLFRSRNSSQSWADTETGARLKDRVKPSGLEHELAFDTHRHPYKGQFAGACGTKLSTLDAIYIPVSNINPDKNSIDAGFAGVVRHILTTSVVSYVSVLSRPILAGPFIHVLWPESFPAMCRALKRPRTSL